MGRRRRRSVTESPFRAWSDRAGRETAAVGPTVLAEALHASAEQSYYVAAGHLARRRHRRAAHIIAFAARHVSVPASLARTALRQHRTPPPHVARLVSLRSGRLVTYDPRPRIGPRLDRVEAS